MIPTNGPTSAAWPLSSCYPLVNPIGLLLPFFGQDVGGEVLVTTPLFTARLIAWGRVDSQASGRAEWLKQSMMNTEFQGVDM